MLIWYLLIIVVCGTTGVMILITLFKYAREKREGAAAPVPRERPDATPLPLLRGALNGILLANLGHDDRTADLMDLSDLIRRLEAGEQIERDSVLEVLSRLNGTGELIEAIKGMEG